MSEVKDIYNYIDSFAPFDTAFSYDNCGVLVGDNETEVFSCVIALDMTQDVITFAKIHKSNLIITHHPVIFEAMKSITSGDLVYQLIQNNISVISAHTNLDLAVGGVNDALASRLGLSEIKVFENEDNIGRVGVLEQELSCIEFAKLIKQKIGARVVDYTDCGKKIKSVAVIGGEGSNFYIQSRKYDAYVTGEVKHHTYSYAKNMGVQLFVAGHYETEVVVLEPLKMMLEQKFSDITFLVYDNFDTKSV